MSRIPGKVAHRKAATVADLLSLLSEREIGYCDADKTAYMRVGGELRKLGGSDIDIPTTISLLMGFEEDAEKYTYNWKSLESIEPIPDNPLKLWSRLAGMGLYAEVAHMDSKGRDISEQLDYASVLIASYDETKYSVIDSAISSGKSVILSIGHSTRFAYLQSKINSGYVFRSILSEDLTYVDYTVSSDDTWSSNTYDLGESSPTQGSNKLLTSGGAFIELAKKVNATNMTPGTYTKVSVNEQGAVTNGGGLEESDLPTHEHSAEDITSGTLDPDRIGEGSVPIEKLEIHKRLYVDGTTISATETADSVVISAEPKLSDMIHEDSEGAAAETTLPKSLVSVPGGYGVKKGFYVPYPGNTTCLGRIVDVDDSETPPTCTIELCDGLCDELNRRVDLSNAVIPLDLNASNAENEYTRAVELCDAGVVPVLQYMVTNGVAYARLSSRGSWGLRFTGCDGFTVTQITISTTYAVSVDSRTIPVS